MKQTAPPSSSPPRVPPPRIDDDDPLPFKRVWWNLQRLTLQVVLQGGMKEGGTGGRLEEEVVLQLEDFVELTILLLVLWVKKEGGREGWSSRRTNNTIGRSNITTIVLEVL